MTDILQRLRERKIVQWGVAYLASAWAALQVLQFLTETYHWPSVIVRVAPVLLAGGLLLVLTLAWFHGQAGKQRLAPLEAFLLSAIVLATIAAAAVLAPERIQGVASPDSKTDSKSVAVLPFASLSKDEDNAYFASGIHDELLTQLAKLGDLKVISRTSVLGYKDTKKPLRQIASELGVAAVVEGSVQRSGNRVRVQAQLIDGRTDEHLWAERYDRELTDVFAIQSDIAQQIATALKARLTSGEQATLQKKPTENADAYDAYLRAREYVKRQTGGRDELASAVTLFQRAVTLDPQFALAYAWLSEAYGRYHWFGWDASGGPVEKQKRAAETAMRIDPSLPESHMARGYYFYWVLRDYARAIEAFKRASELAPGNADIISAIGYVKRRQGKYEETIARLQQAVKLDPHNPDFHHDGLGRTYWMMRRYADALREFDQTITLAPDFYDPKGYKGWVEIATNGRLDTLRAVLSSENLKGDSYESPDYDRFLLAMYERDYAAAVRAAEAAPVLIQRQDHYTPRSLLLGRAYTDTRRLKHLNAARTQLETAARAQPKDARIALGLGYVYAALGRKADAVQQAHRARSLMPPTVDVWLSTMIDQRAAEVLAQAGAAEEAIPLIKDLLSKASLLTVNELRLNPSYDPIRADARFRELVR